MYPGETSLWEKFSEIILWCVWIAFSYVSNQMWAEQTRNEKVIADSCITATTIVKQSTQETSTKIFCKGIFNTFQISMFKIWQMWNLFDSKSTSVTFGSPWRLQEQPWAWHKLIFACISSAGKLQTASRSAWQCNEAPKPPLASPLKEFK